MSVEHAEARLASVLLVELFLAMAEDEDREDELPDCDTAEPVACAG